MVNTPPLQPLTITIQQQNIYIAAGLGVLVLVLLGVISSVKKRRNTQNIIISKTLGD